MSNKILMPKGVAAWLIRNTKLSFEQIGDFCDLHIMEIQNLADKEKIKGINPVLITKEVDKEEIERCEADPKAKLTRKVINNVSNKTSNQKRQIRQYIPLAHRKNKQKAALWIIQNYPAIQDKDIKKLLDINLDTITKLRNKTYSSYFSLTAQDPVMLQLCSKDALENLINKAITKDTSLS